MRFTLAAAALLASLFSARAQTQNDPASIEGTWSSGTGAVSTGGQICIPGTLETTTFTYPNNTGISYSFTTDGHFEEVLYRYKSNATDPRCITGFISWQHGTYTFEGDGLKLTPFESDGRIQVQDPCAAVTNQITYYNQIMTMKNWGVSIDPLTARYTLNLFGFDGAPVPPLYLIARPPNMLPTHTLTGTNSTGQTSTRRRRYSVTSLLKRLANADSA
ncbi:Reversal of tor2 lethality [Vanrija albida]|uniref:Protein ROT1 n=1 Tax=Vanrija albida TaxID=181172 RepID=A0ABR3Q5Q2_9TREE